MPENITITQGEEYLARFPADENKTGRMQCNCCGSKLYTETMKGRPLSVYTSTLNNESQEKVEVMAHTNVGSKSPTVQIQDDLPQFTDSITRDDYMKLIS